jgi:hypothetical protein
VAGAALAGAVGLLVAWAWEAGRWVIGCVSDALGAAIHPLPRTVIGR